MSHLQYRTVSNTSPQGKPRVFFACHPMDFASYSERIFRDLFSALSCAVYFPDSAENMDTEELLQDISQMQLIIFAVTEKLLNEPNFAMDRLFPFAEEHHIPILPLMQEQVDSKSFSRRFGDLHFLDRSRITATSISYEEQFKKYVTSVLVDDELAQKVRGAFDAYIFLSYRKKDRKYAQELMRLIHQNPFCRDIAIWYDEFLVPGESFNNAIGEMLKKCDLFALAVTPNLVNETNYVMTTEYPNALRQNKKMLAAEMQPTERRELEDKYADFPPCTDPRNEKELVGALQDALSSIAKRENDSDPEHLYFIGLAYLAGIDVEVDHEKAVELITRSHNAGYTEATKKLVSMYRYGEGVKRSYKTAIELQSKYVDHLHMVFEAIEIVRKTSLYPAALFELARLYELSRDSDAQEKTLRSIIRLSEENDESWSGVYNMAAVQSLGEMYSDQGSYDEARKLFLDNRQYCRSEKEKGFDGFAIFEAQDCLMLADLHRKGNETESAIRFCHEAIDLADRYSDKSDYTSVYLNAYRLLIQLETTAGHLDKAETYLKKVEAIYDGLQQAGKDVSAGLASLEEKKNSLQSEKVFQKDISDVYKNYRRNMSSDYEQDKKDLAAMIESLQALRDSKSSNVDHAAEIDKLSEYLEKLQPYADSPEIEDRRRLADGYYQLGLAQTSDNRNAEAEASLLKALAFYRDYTKDHSDPESVLLLIAVLSGLNIACDSQKQYDKARQYGEETIRLSEQVVARRGNTRDYMILIAACNSFAAQVHAQGQTNEARVCYKKAISAGIKLLEQDSGRRPREMLAENYNALAYLAGETKPDRAPLLEALRIYTKLKEDYPGDLDILAKINGVRGSLMRSGMTLTAVDEALQKGSRKGLFSRLFGKK